ncbi:MAG: hypothetical protein ACP5EN_13425, partial [Rhodovulum sp.]
ARPRKQEKQMKHEREIRPEDAACKDATLADVLVWAEETGESRDAIYELKKIPARMDLLDEEINLLPADLPHFDNVIAQSPYGAVSRARNLDAARRRGNARVRALLERFFASRGYGRPDASARESYDVLIERLMDLEGFADDGALLPTSTHKCFYTLRARCCVPLDALDQAEIDRVFSEATSDARRSLRKAIGRIAMLRRDAKRWPEIAGLLPAEPLRVPASRDRARRIVWAELPEVFRIDAEQVFQRALRRPDDLKAWALAELKAGRSASEIDAEIAEIVGKKKRIPRNTKTAIAGYRQAVTWLLREQVSPEAGFDGLTTLRDLFQIDALEAACKAQIERSTISNQLKDPCTSSTLWSRVTNLRTLARHGLRDPDLLAMINIVRLSYEEYLVSPTEMTADVDAVCDRLRKSPHLAAAFVNAPSRLHALAESALQDARSDRDRLAEERALRLFEVAAAYAVQVSRPLRPGNLFTIRDRALAGCPRNLTWLEDRKHAEIRFAGKEVKNGHALTVQVSGSDAKVLWDWHKTYRQRLIELRDLPDSPYIFPGSARPRLRESGLALPDGCLSAAAIAELWDLGDRHLGLGLTPHQCRHAVATLSLAVHPGDFARVASILANEESVARRHYGKDSGEQAAAAIRQSLLAKHPDIFQRLRRSRT